jgi:hypothetical protein
LIDEIKKIIDEFKNTVRKVDIYSNVVDPFSALFDMVKQGIDFDDWLKQEEFRQAQKTLQNQVGYFHQNILGKVEGWKDTGIGGSIDLINVDEKIIVELKNKHNTLNSSSSIQTYRKMVNHLDGDNKGYAGYVVTIIPLRATRFIKNFAPNDDGGIKLPVRNDLKIIDGWLDSASMISLSIDSSVICLKVVFAIDLLKLLICSSYFSVSTSTLRILSPTMSRKS